MIATTLATATAAAAPPARKAPRKTPAASRARSTSLGVQGLLLGLGVAMGPILIGSARMASGDSLAAKNTGLILISTGLTLGPIMAHIATGELRRAAIFGAIPAACTAGLTALLFAQETAAFNGSVGTRTAFATLLTTALFTAGAGFIDVLNADERARGEGRKFFFIGPEISEGKRGLTIGGLF